MGSESTGGTISFEMLVETGQQTGYFGVLPALVELVFLHKPFGIQKVRVHEAGKQHPYPQSSVINATHRRRGGHFGLQNIGWNGDLQSFVEMDTVL